MHYSFFPVENRAPNHDDDGKIAKPDPRCTPS